MYLTSTVGMNIPSAFKFSHFRSTVEEDLTHSPPDLTNEVKMRHLTMNLNNKQQNNGGNHHQSKNDRIAKNDPSMYLN